MVNATLPDAASSRTRLSDVKQIAEEQKTALIDVRAVASLLDCSTRHIYRLTDSGAMPPPVRLGALIRWNRDALLEWIDAGCPCVDS